MNIIVDTSIWSLALRRARQVDEAPPRELVELIHEGRVVMLGATRQELLSGMKNPRQFEVLRERLWAFPDLALETADYENAASAFNRCRERGIQGSNTDFLICAAAQRRDYAIFTSDGVFRHFARVLDLKLHESRV